MSRGRKKESEKCQVSGCDEAGERSMPRGKVKDALGRELEGEGKRVRLCRAHYREYKKATKDERRLEALRR